MGNRKATKGRIKQTVYSEPRRIFKERYITDHMLEKAIRMGMSKKEAFKIYSKNRYTINKNAKPVKVIEHSLPSHG